MRTGDLDEALAVTGVATGHRRARRRARGARAIRRAQSRVIDAIFWRLSVEEPPPLNVPPATVMGDWRLAKAWRSADAAIARMTRFMAADRGLSRRTPGRLPSGGVPAQACGEDEALRPTSNRCSTMTSDDDFRRARPSCRRIRMSTPPRP
jgi:hypothetical protein